MSRKITSDMRDAMITHVFGFKKTNTDTAKTLGVSESCVSLTVNTFTAVRDQDWAGLKRLITNRNAGLPLLMWAQDRTEVTIPGEIIETWESTLKRNKETLGAPEPEPAPQDVNALVLCEKLIKAQDAILATLGDILDGLKVLASDIKDNNNVNTDLICQKLNQTTELLNGIKANTRKKGL